MQFIPARIDNLFSRGRPAGIVRENVSYATGQAGWQGQGVNGPVGALLMRLTNQQLRPIGRDIVQPNIL